MRQTLKRIGQAIRAGAKYLPLRNYAAALATTAAPKDYLGQARAIYDDLTRRRWRYVRDPARSELLTYTPDALFNLVLGGDGVGLGRGRGGGDCDCIAALSGALLESIGFQTRLGTTAPMQAPPGRLFSHVFVQAFIPKRGWLTFDPVLYPNRPLGAMSDRSRSAFYDLNGNLIAAYGNTTPALSGYGGIDMQMQYNPQDWPDQGPYLGFGGSDGYEPDDWRRYSLRDYGAHAETMGIMGGLGLMVEAPVQMVRGQVVARTPMLELAKEDYHYLAAGNKPYDGMLALGDDTSVYYYDGLGGFFKRLWGGIKKVGKRIAKGAKRLIKKIPGGKYLIRMGSKLYKVAMKVVKPLAKYVGKYAAKLAPVAALIPGYGPAISAALFSAGKVANLMTKYGAVLTGPKGKVRGLKFKGGKHNAKAFKQALEKAAKAQAAKQKAKRRGMHKTKTVSRRTPRLMKPMIARAVRRRPTVSRAQVARG